MRGEHRATRLGVLTLAAILLASTTANAEEPAAAADPKAEEFFETNIRPLLLSKCAECHGPDKQKSNLRVDALAHLIQGGDSGPALVPGKPEESLLVTVVGYASDIKMPPKSKLSDKEIASITEWVKRGAVWPKSAPVTTTPKGTDGKPLFTAEDKAFWAFQPVSDPPPPAVKEAAWPISPLDHFLLADLEARNLRPASPASKRTLIRRATFDLTGLPPTVDEINGFLADETPDAFARVVDRLLASTHYGERWGRHWLDLARYADSNGLDENLAYANAWHYRDYVVSAFNSDMPYDQFVKEQIAGDLLPATGDHTRRMERIIATGFLALGAKMLAEDDPVKMQMDIIDEQVDTIGRTFLGLTLGCARCHDHKYDPLPTEDYYSLAGIFKSTKTMENFGVVAVWQERPIATEEDTARHQAHKQKINEKQGVIGRLVEQTNKDIVAAAKKHAAQYLLAGEEQRRLDLLAKTTQALPRESTGADVTGAVVVEAENFIRSGNTVKSSEGYGQGIGVLLSPTGGLTFAEYDFTAPVAGQYQFQMRYAAAGARPFKLFINGELVKAEAAAKATGSWFPDTQAWELQGFYRLKAGANTVRFERTDPFPHVDKFLVAPISVAEGVGDSLTGSDLATDGYMPNREIAKQWSAYLEQTRTEDKGALAVWHAYLAPQRKLPAELAKQHPDSPAALFGDFQPKSLSDLAKRYQDLFDDVDREWTALRATPAGQSAQALPDARREALRQVLYAPQGPYALPKAIESTYPAEVATNLAKERGELKTLEQSLPPLSQTMAVSDAKAENLKVHLRGSHLTLGKETPRQFPRIIAGEQQTAIDTAQSGRLPFAEWMVSPDHPLTSRVMVNRVWQWHFGEGLVRSPDNFGRLGERPTHPQLLDWLSRRFIESGWSLKALHRLMMLSSTYQMSTAWNAEAALADPENRLLWRMNRRRLDAEEIRDALLGVSGSLDPKLGGTLLLNKNREYVTVSANVNPAVYANTRRSIYLPVVRSAIYEVFQAFDFADPSVPNGRRDSTTVAPQALFMMNSAVVSQQSKALAQSLLADGTTDDAARVTRAFERVLGRRSSSDETARGVRYVSQYLDAAKAKDKETKPEHAIQAWQSLCRALFASNEFLYVE